MTPLSLVYLQPDVLPTNSCVDRHFILVMFGSLGCLDVQPVTVTTHRPAVHSVYLTGINRYKATSRTSQINNTWLTVLTTITRAA